MTEETQQTLFDQAYSEFIQKKDVQKVRWLDQLPKRVPPVFLKRIQANDKTVLHELMMPAWLKWEVLYSWATQKTGQKDQNICALCQQIQQNGIHFHSKFVCETCFKTLRSMGAERTER